MRPASPSPIRKPLQNIAKKAFRSRPLARWLFGVDFVPVTQDHYYWDTTTYVTTRRAQASLGPSNRVVDMGTGTAAAVGLYLWKHVGCTVISVDINPRIVAMAEAAVALNGAPIKVVQSSFFDNVEGTFDTVIFNPPYVPTQAGEDRKLSEETRTQWDGGAEGMDVIDGFLDRVAALPHAVTVYMGINDWHVGKRVILAAIAQRKLVLEDVSKHAVLPVYVYVFRNVR